MILVDREAAQHYVSAGIWGKIPLDGILARNASVRPNTVALVDRGDRVGWRRTIPSEMTWRQIDHMVSAVSALFLDFGLKQDAIVAIQLGNTAEALIAHLAALRAGLIPVALPLIAREHELKAAFERIAPLAVITGTRIGPNDHCDLMMRVAAEILSIRHIFAFGDAVPDGVCSLNEALLPNASSEGGNGAPRPGNPADHVAIATLANWDSRLEPVARSHNQWLSAATEVILNARIGPDAALATTLLPSSLAGIACGLGAWLLSGCQLILVMPLTSAAFCREIGGLAATHLVLPGKLAHLAARLDPERRTRLIRYWCSPEAFDPAQGSVHADTTMTDVVSLDEMALTAGSGRRTLVLPIAPVDSPVDDAEAGIEADTSAPQAALLTARMPGAMVRAGSGLMPGALMSGALLLGGPQVPTAPLRAGDTDFDESYRFAPHPDGFRETGLRCRRVDDGPPMLAVQGHRTETFVTGGMAVGADSLDTVFRAYDGFADAAAASVADPLFGERIVAAVVPKPGMDCSLAAFRAYLRRIGVAPYMVPDRIIAVAEIPRTGTGSVLRSAIATSLAA
ncbi:AMP-binding protein [Microbaculum marinisediminis]|uniref:Acyl--CoA ligase n=1 Tax=Microbaculum marinisediminis TaxID=2931392 RepID=A0AAW5R1L3_9HYPH|nr:class I adenylate-forming enzyme family protein [Microbaculum sp. A6E488]MCT8974087.1 acyl--CoA ligase [Microbaculum sp. A6E488]